MNSIFRNILQVGFISAVLLLILFQPAWAEESAGGWRPTYDLVMRWVNFFILLIFLIKIVGPILMRFLAGQQEEIQSRIDRVRKEKDDILARVQEARDHLEHISSRLEKVKGRIIERGENRKQEIIDNANEQAQLMMKHARQRIDNQIIHARQKIMREMVDLAMEKALERLPAEISEEDNHRLVERYFS